MSDLEICKRIAEIEGVYHHLSETEVKHVMVRDNSVTWMIRFVEYNPLTDDALCFQLMLKYDMPPMKVSDSDLYDCIISDDLDLLLIGGGTITDKSPNKAICLAIIEAHKEQ